MTPLAFHGKIRHTIFTFMSAVRKYIFFINTTKTSLTFVHTNKLIDFLVSIKPRPRAPEPVTRYSSNENENNRAQPSQNERYYMHQDRTGLPRMNWSRSLLSYGCAAVKTLFNVHIQSFHQLGAQRRPISYRETMTPLVKCQAVLIKPRSIQRVFQREENKMIYLSNQEHYQHYQNITVRIMLTIHSF